MEYALIYTIAAILAGAMTGALVTVWHLRIDLLKVQTELDGLADRVEGIVERIKSAQVKEAAKSRWSKKDLEDQALLGQMRAKPVPTPDDGPFAQFWPPTI